MLGKQFDHTYWTDSSGNTSYYRPIDEGFINNPRGLVMARPDFPGFGEKKPHQGLLFHPSEGTDIVRNTDDIKNSLDFLPEEADKAANAVVHARVPRAAMEHLQSQRGRVRLVDSYARSYASGSTVYLHKNARTKGLDYGAMSHELGHAMDSYEDKWSQQEGPTYTEQSDGSYRVNPARPDPRSEGVADGVADRFTRLPEAWDTPEAAATTHATTGYSTGFSGFKDKTAKALYAAVRAHAASSDLALKDIPTRDSLMDKPKPAGTGGRQVRLSQKSGKTHRTTKQYLFDADLERDQKQREANALLLGYMAHEHPHVVAHLEAQGFGKVTNAALGEYRNRFPAQPHPVQLRSALDYHHRRTAEKAVEMLNEHSPRTGQIHPQQGTLF